jgi:prolipoprotein diacylglyceryltransferase
MEFTLLFAAAMAYVTGVIALRWEAARGNAADCARDLGEILLTAAVVGLFVGRLAAMIGSGVNPLTSLMDILIVRGGVATGPAALAALTTVAFVARNDLIVVADALAVAALAALGGWQLGCLPREACLGTPTDLPWAMSQPGSTIGRHPVELYAAAIYLFAAMALALLRKRPMAPGLAAATALLVAAGGRLATEPLRPSLGGGPVWWYTTGVVIGLGAAAWALRHHPVSPPPPAQP